MLTKNYKKLVAMCTDYANSSYGEESATKDTEYEITDVLGATYLAKFNNNRIVTSTIAQGISLWNANHLASIDAPRREGIHFGDGSSVSEDDYYLTGNRITTISTTSVQEVILDGNIINKKIVFTISNTGTDDITISEIGLVGQFTRHYNTSATASEYLLLEHTLLNEPVIIPAGGVGQVTYTITFNFA